jgi:IS5 family transposase
MKPRKKHHRNQSGFLGMLELETGLDQRHELYRLAEAINWQEIEDEFVGFYSHTGRPGLPIRRMAGLLILKQVQNLSDERVCEYWRESPYAQYFCGEVHFQWGLPCEPSELVHFRKRIGERGVKKLFTASLRLHEDKIERESELVVDTTVQEANVTYPTETKLREQVIKRLWRMGKKQGIQWERSYRFTLSGLSKRARSRSNRCVKDRRKAILKLRTVGRDLLRQYRSEASIEAVRENWKLLETMDRILTQSFNEPANERVHSLHDPQVRCIAKGKAHKPYVPRTEGTTKAKRQWGRKAGFAMLAKSNLVVGVASFRDNLYDGDTLAKTLASAHSCAGKLFGSCLVDRGYKGQTRVGPTEVIQPYRIGLSNRNAYQKRKHRKRMNRRGAIEPIIGHLKNDHRMARCYLKGYLGSVSNAYLAAMAWNLKMWMRERLFVRILAGLYRSILDFYRVIRNQGATLRGSLRLTPAPSVSF